MLDQKVFSVLLFGPVVGASAVLLPLILVRLAAYRRARIAPAALAAEAAQVGVEGKPDAARVGALAREYGGPLAAGLGAAMSCAGQSADKIERVTGAAVDEEFARLEAGDAWLGFFANSGPLYGLASALLVLATGLAAGAGPAALLGHFGHALYAIFAGVGITAVALFAHTAVHNRHLRARARVNRLLARVVDAAAGPHPAAPPRRGLDGWTPLAALNGKGVRS